MIGGHTIQSPSVMTLVCTAQSSHTLIEVARVAQEESHTWGLSRSDRPGVAGTVLQTGIALLLQSYFEIN